MNCHEEAYVETFETSPHFKYVCCGGLWRPIVGTYFPLVEETGANPSPHSSIRPGYPIHPETSGIDAGTSEVVIFYFFPFSIFIFSPSRYLMHVFMLM